MARQVGICSANCFQTSFTGDCFVTKGRKKRIPHLQDWNGFWPHDDYYRNIHAAVRSLLVVLNYISSYVLSIHFC
jgi:hypothetical protein